MSGTDRRKVWFSETLALGLGASLVDWGEPDEDGFYTPALTRPAAPAEGLDVRIALWEATIAAHYAEDHQSVMPGDRVDGCTEGRCPEWFALSNALTPEDDR